MTGMTYVKLVDANGTPYSDIALYPALPEPGDIIIVKGKELAVTKAPRRFATERHKLLERDVLCVSVVAEPVIMEAAKAPQAPPARPARKAFKETV
jgi:hypothetical protein